VSDWEIFTARIQGGNVTPMTYRVSATGKQYLVIAAGGHPKITEEKLGDSLSAFATSLDQLMFEQAPGAGISIRRFNLLGS